MLSNHYNHEKSTKIKVILEMCVVKFKKVQITQGVTLSLNTTGVKRQNFVEKKADKAVFHNFDPLKYAKHA